MRGNSHVRFLGGLERATARANLVQDMTSILTRCSSSFAAQSVAKASATKRSRHSPIFSCASRASSLSMSARSKGKQWLMTPSGVSGSLRIQAATKLVIIAPHSWSLEKTGTIFLRFFSGTYLNFARPMKRRANQDTAASAGRALSFQCGCLWSGIAEFFSLA